MGREGQRDTYYTNVTNNLLVLAYYLVLAKTASLLKMTRFAVAFLRGLLLGKFKEHRVALKLMGGSSLFVVFA